MTPTTAAVIAESGAVNAMRPCVVSMSGAPSRMKTNDGRKVNHVATQAAAIRQYLRVGAQHRLGVAADEADESDDHDQRPGSRLAERQSVDHLCRTEPAVLDDRALVDVRQHRVRAAKGQQRRLAEEHAHLRERSRPS